MNDFPDTPSAIAAALGAGRLDEEAALRALEPFLALAGDSADADALALAGFCRLRRGETEAALALLDRALERQPGHWVARVNRAEARRAAGRWGGAAADYREALAARPVPELWVNLAQALRAAGDAPGERAALDEALRLDPESAAAWNNLGLHHETAGREEEALAAFARAGQLAPDDDDVAQNLGRALFAKGRRLDGDDSGSDSHAALRYYEEQIALHPAIPGLRLGLGLYWLDRTEVGKAEEVFAGLLRLSPHDPAVLTNHGVALERLGRSKEALAAYQRAAAAERLRAGRPDAPLSAALRWNQSLSLLALGRLKEGFAGYEARATGAGVALAPPPQGVPRWNGEPFAGKTLVLHAEQGFGDAIQFIRYAALAKALSPTGTVTAACPAPLARLFAHAAGVDRVVPPDAWPEEAAFHLPLLSLPRVFGTELATVPAAVPYFSLPAPRRDGAGKIRIGLVWSGNPRYANDRRRSCPLPLLEEAGWPALPGVEWHSFQAGPAAAQAAARPWLRDRAPELTDFYETALRLRECDLVVTVDTAAAHLAGALGVPAWILLPFACDWRWLRRRGDSPWYPAARLFRHPAEGDWRGCLAEVTAALRERLGV